MREFISFMYSYELMGEGKTPIESGHCINDRVPLK